MGLQLQVSVAQLLKERVGAVRALEIDGTELEMDDGPPAYVRGALRLTRTDRGVWASGPVGYAVEHVCSRCLAPFASWAQAQVDDVFLPSVDLATGAKVRLEEGEDADANSIDERHVLDLSETLRQYRLAAIEMAPVCKEDCKGICAECGADMNASACSCERYLDQRWSVLRELIK